MTLDPRRRLAVLREVAAADPDGDVAFLLDLLSQMAIELVLRREQDYL